MSVRVTERSAALLLFALFPFVACADEIYSTGFETETFSLGIVKNQDGWQGAQFPYITTAEPHSGEQSVQIDGRDLLRFTPDTVVGTVSWRQFSLEDPVTDICVDGRLDGPSTNMGNGPADDGISANLTVRYDGGAHIGTVIISSADTVWTFGERPADHYIFESAASLAQYHNLALRIDSDAEVLEYFLNGELLGAIELPPNAADRGIAEISMFAAGDGSIDLTSYTAYFDNFHISSDGCVQSPLGHFDALQAGDADQDFDFDQLDLVQVQIAGKYLSGRLATWGEGDWDGAPGGEPGRPPEGNGLFDQLDVIAALAAGIYLTGPYNEPPQNHVGRAPAALAGPSLEANDQASIVYHAATGELAVNAPVGVELSSINIDAATAIFTGDPAQNLGGSFDNDTDNNLFKATFGGSFGSISFGNVARPGLPDDLVLGALTVVGSLASGGQLGDVDLIYIPVPEPTGVGLFSLGVLSMSVYVCKSTRQSLNRHVTCDVLREGPRRKLLVATNQT